MSWAFVRPSDPDVLDGRPLLDLGTGDGATVRALAPEGLVVGVDRERRLLRRGNVQAVADTLPFGPGTFGTVLAADLVHHLDDAELTRVLREIRRVLRPGGRLVAWWYEHTSDTAPDAPRHCRSYDVVAAAARIESLDPSPLELHTAAGGSPTAGLLAT